MYSSYSRSSSPPDSQPRHHHKMILQRQYREKEGECFNALRDVIKGLTGEEPLTRQEILRKAIELLSDPQIRRLRGDAAILPGPADQQSPPGPSGPPGLPDVNPVSEDTLAYMDRDYPTQSSQLNWQNVVDFDSAHYYGSAHPVPLQTHPYQVSSNTNPSGSDVVFQGFDGSWSAYQ